jgi:hypothetical protein
VRRRWRSWRSSSTFTLVALQPVVAAVERAGTKIDADLAWAMLAVEADRQRRRAIHGQLLPKATSPNGEVEKRKAS